LIKYIATAAALKLFSATPQTRQIYRLLGNTLGQKRRIQHGLDRQYVNRVRKILEMCEKYQAIQESGRLLEVGTGWVHWESTIIRLFYDVEIILFDVWDNRHFGAYKRYLEQLEQIIDQELKLDFGQSERVHTLLQAISRANSFDEIYVLLGFKYVINSNGTLEPFQDESFDAIISWNVLEHVDRVILPAFIQDFHRLLKPGGYSIQKIDPGDHLAYYDSGVCRKNYLRYSEKVWRLYFENKVQYFNRVQRPDWLDLFQKAGFELVEEEPQFTDVSTIEVDKSYGNLSRQDLECMGLVVVHRKPQNAKGEIVNEQAI
jgi:hypothetical protein